MALLARSPDAPLTNRDIAEQCQIPERYLAAVLRAQVVAGLVASQRGRGGGYSLLKPPQDIPIEDVLRAAGFDIQGRPCAFGWAQCDPESPCPLHPLYSELNHALTTWAGQRTLAEVDTTGT